MIKKWPSSKRMILSPILPPHENEVKFLFEIKGDSSLLFGNDQFYKIDPDAGTFVPNYKLIGFTAKNLFKNSKPQSVRYIHLIKRNDSIKVILNDMVTELPDIPLFLACEDCLRPSVIAVCLGGGITFYDLLNAYKWIYSAGINQVLLITDNKRLVEFYYQKDNIQINDSLMMEFFLSESIPPPPPRPIGKMPQQMIVQIADKKDFTKLPIIKDSGHYLIEVDVGIPIFDYLKLNELIGDRENLSKEIKCLNR